MQRRLPSLLWSNIDRTFREFIAKGFFGGARRMKIACEVMTPDGDDPLELMENYAQLLRAAWERAARAGVGADTKKPDF